MKNGFVEPERNAVGVVHFAVPLELLQILPCAGHLTHLKGVPEAPSPGFASERAALGAFDRHSPVEKFLSVGQPSRLDQVGALGQKQVESPSGIFTACPHLVSQCEEPTRLSYV